MSALLTVTVWVLVGVSFGLAVQLPLRITTAAWPLHVPKAAAQALSTYLIIAGLLASALAVTLFARRPSAARVQVCRERQRSRATLCPHGP